MFLTYLCTTLLLLTGFLLMFIVLLQRGRGGGLAGAFGGLGGQSAFGTKAGDVFTKITIVLAVIWVSLAGVTGFAMRYDSEKTSFTGKKPPENPELKPPPGKTAPKPSPQKPKGPVFPPKSKPNSPDTDDVPPKSSKPKVKQKTPDQNDDGKKPKPGS
jgi:preprotein translocase subunit SecG